MRRRLSESLNENGGASKGDADTLKANRNTLPSQQ